MDKSKIAMAVTLVLLTLVGLPLSYSAGRKSVIRRMIQRNSEQVQSSRVQYSPPPKMIPPFLGHVPTPAERITDPPISEAQFQRIQQGMTYDQVVQILGRNGVCSFQSHSMIGGRPHNLDTYEWKWNGGKPIPSRLTVSFENGYVDHTNWTN